MSLPVHNKPEAAADVSEAYYWYERKEPGVGEQFKQAVREASAAIQANPMAWPNSPLAVRAVKLKYFPHKIIYTVEADEILVWSVWHPSRNPKELAKRVKRIGKGWTSRPGEIT